MPDEARRTEANDEKSIVHGANKNKERYDELAASPLERVPWCTGQLSDGRLLKATLPPG